MSRARRFPVRYAARILLLATGCLALSGVGCREKVQPGHEPVVQTAGGDANAVAVEKHVDPAFERASGTVASSHETTVSAKILARIEKVQVTAGSIVRKGDLLVRLDDRDLRAQEAQTQEDLRAANARLDLATREEGRIQKLFKAEVASEEQLDQVRSALRVARANVQAAQQRVADANVAVSDAEIRTPVGGRVIDRLAEPGDMASPGVPLLRIYDPSALRLEAPVRERLAVSLRVGQRLRVYFDALDESLEGPIEEIVPFAEPGARTLLIKVRLPDDPRLFAGMYGRLDVPAGLRERIVIPDTAVTRIGQLAFATVFVTDDGVERRWITTSRPDEVGQVEVLSGLALGERVLVPETQ